MLRLNLTNAPRWIDLAPDVRVEVLPMGTGLISRAQTDLRLAADDEDDAAKMPLSTLALAIARHAIIDWEGVGDADGAPLGISPEGIAALMNLYPVYLAFERLYVVPGLVLADEGNVFAPLLPGTLAGALPIVQTAPAAVSPAPMKKKRRAA